MDHPEILHNQQLAEPVNKSQQQGKQSELTSESSKMRILLLGKHGAGKSATGNSILGKQVFESKFSEEPVTKTCKRESGAVGEGEIVVIDTPDIFSTRICAEEREQEVRKWIILCSPGPHILLLVTCLSFITVEDEEMLKGIQEIFGTEAMQHIILLFTRKEDLEDDSLQEYINETDNDLLRKLVQNCGGHYCAFNNKAGVEEQNVQVKNLFKLIDCLMEKKGQSYADFNENIGKKENTIESNAYMLPKPTSAKESLKLVNIVQNYQKKDNAYDILSLIIVGKSGTGKSSTGNTIIGRNEFVAKLGAKPITERCCVNERIWKGKTVFVVDTPSFIYPSNNKDFYQEEEIIRCLTLSLEARIFILVIQLGRFTEEDEKTIRQLEVIFGRDVTKYMIVLFTRKDDLGTGSLKSYIEDSQNKPLKTLIKKCENRFCAFNNKEGDLAQEKQANELLKMVDNLVQNHGGQGYPFDIGNFEPSLKEIVNHQQRGRNTQSWI